MIQPGQKLETMLGGAPVQMSRGGPLEMISSGNSFNAILAARLIGQGLDVTATIGSPTLTTRFGLGANGLEAGPGNSIRPAGQSADFAQNSWAAPASQPQKLEM